MSTWQDKIRGSLIGGAIGGAYLVALRGIYKFEKKVDDIKKSIGIDEQ